MKTRTAEEKQVRCITINTRENDPVDIRCGGPAFLGFDFRVDADIKDWEGKIKKIFTELKFSYQSIDVSKPKWVGQNYKVWTIDEIKECIKKEY